VYKRGNVYWIKFYAGKKPYYLPAKTTKKRESESLLSFYLGQVAQGEFTGVRPEPLSMQGIFDDFLKDCKYRKLRGLDIVQFHLKPVRAWFGNLPADQITALDVKRYKEHRQAQGRAVATVNRELQYLGQALRLAQANDLIAKVPKTRKDAEHNARQGFFRQGDVARLLAALPDDLRDFVLFGYLTGWRKGRLPSSNGHTLRGGCCDCHPRSRRPKTVGSSCLPGNWRSSLSADGRHSLMAFPGSFIGYCRGSPGLRSRNFIAPGIQHSKRPRFLRIGFFMIAAGQPLGT
jgi:hypothetical protein